MTAIVGLDLSLRCTGVAHIDGTTSHLTSNLVGMMRIASIAERCEEAWQVADMVVIEDYAFSRGQQAHATGELGGVIRYLLHLQRIPYVNVKPTTLKKFAVGKGTATKADMIVAASKLGVDFTGKGAEDKCDAYWLRQMALYHYNYNRASEAPITKYRDEACGAITWPAITAVHHA